MAINFPSNPNIGDEFSAAGKSWTWNGSQWEGIVVDAENNFVIRVDNSEGNSYILDKTYPAGGYTVFSGTDDLSIDIYLLNSSDVLVGTSHNRGVAATAEFSKIVIIGQPLYDTLSFRYNGLAIDAAGSGENITAGPYISSYSPSSLPNIDDTTVITGGNFANNIEVVFIGTDSVIRPAKNITRSDSKTLIVTRPDSLPIGYGPYEIKVSNPGVPNPVGSNLHRVINAISPGSFPSWVTPSDVSYLTNSAFSYSLLASDTEASDIDYSIVSGTLPNGLSLNQETGLISGTPTANQKNTIVFRATDAGGNFVDKTITLVYGPVWQTSQLPTIFLSDTYSVSISATDANSATVSYSVVNGSLPPGISLNSSTGLLSGTATQSFTGNITIRASAFGYGFTDKEFSIQSKTAQVATITSTQSWTVPAGISSIKVFVAGGGGGGYAYGGNDSVAGPGGGAGGAAIQSLFVTAGQSYPVVIGAGGNGGGNALNGSNSSFNTSIIGIGGGGAGSYYNVGKDGGCGGGGWTAGGIGSQGFNGGFGTNSQYNAGAGGGMGGAGANGNSGPGGIGIQFLGNYYCGGGGAGRSNQGNNTAGGLGGGGNGGEPGQNGTANTGGGGGGSRGNYSTAGNGGSGVVIVLY